METRIRLAAVSVMVFLLSVFLGFATPAFAQCSYNPGNGGGGAGHDIATDGSMTCVVLPPNTSLKADAHANLNTLKPVGCLAKSNFAFVAPAADGSFSGGILAECGNLFELTSLASLNVNDPGVLCDASTAESFGANMQWYESRNERDLQVTYLHYLAAAADYCPGGSVTMYEDHRTPDWNPNPLTPEVDVARSSQDMFGFSSSIAIKLDRFAGLRSCPDASGPDLFVWDPNYNGEHGHCRRATGMGEEMIALHGEKSPRYDNGDQLNEIDQYLLTRGVRANGEIDSYGGRTYTFPNSCDSVRDEKEKEYVDTYNSYLRGPYGVVSAGIGLGATMAMSSATGDKAALMSPIPIRVGFGVGSEWVSFEMAFRTGALFSLVNCDIPSAPVIGGDVGFTVARAAPVSARISAMYERGIYGSSVMGVSNRFGTEIEGQFRIANWRATNMFIPIPTLALQAGSQSYKMDINADGTQEERQNPYVAGLVGVRFEFGGLKKDGSAKKSRGSTNAPGAR